MYKLDESCELTEKELQILQTCEAGEGFVYLDGKKIGRVLPVEAEYCKKVTGMEYDRLLAKILSEIAPDPWTAIQKLFKQYNEEYKESAIPNLTAFVMQEHIFQAAAEQQS